MKQTDLENIQSLNENHRRLLTAESNAIFLVDGKWKIYFDEKKSHFVTRKHNPENAEHSFAEEVYAIDLEDMVAYQIACLDFIVGDSSGENRMEIVLTGLGRKILECKTVVGC